MTSQLTEEEEVAEVKVIEEEEAEVAEEHREEDSTIRSLLTLERLAVCE